MPSGSGTATEGQHRDQAAKSASKVRGLESLAAEATKIPQAPGETGEVSPFPPYRTEYLWRLFIDVGSCRGINESGPQPISWSELDAWGRVNGLNLTSYEVEAIRKLDSRYLKIVGDHRRQRMEEMRRDAETSRQRAKVRR